MTENVPRSITATLWPIADLAPLGDGVVSVEVGDDDRLYLLQLNCVRYYRLLALDRSGDVQIIDINAPASPDRGLMLQPLPGGRLLLVAARAERGAANGWVYDTEGEVLAQFPLGDAIRRVQTTADGVIWTSYFDEGVFGGNPVARSGLAAWNDQGALLYTYKALWSHDSMTAAR